MLRIAQITDTHLGRDATTEFNGVNVQSRLESVLASVAAWPADVVVATGDLADGGQVPAYRRLKSLFGQLDCPVLVLPGNHDDRAAIGSHLCSDTISCDSSCLFDDWQLLLIDSVVPGHPHGLVSCSDLAALRGAAEPRPAVLFVHHHPLAVNSSWLDAMMLRNGDEMLAAMPATVRAVFFGHVHQNFHGQYQDVPVLGTAATSYQIQPGLDAFALAADGAPAWRRIELGQAGQWNSLVCRVPAP